MWSNRATWSSPPVPRFIVFQSSSPAAAPRHLCCSRFPVVAVRRLIVFLAGRRTSHLAPHGSLGHSDDQDP
ncbi:hypothetical protein ACOSP7_022213 [Xanthoceras sorbifolium]